MNQKGEFGGECNRTVCKNIHAVWYNRSTQRYYCEPCATLLNEVNKEDADRLFDGQLCIIKDNPFTN